MGKCRWIKVNNKIVGAKTIGKKRSEVFDSLANQYGLEKAIELYSVSQSDNFQDIFGEEEQKTSTIVRYVAEQNENKNPLTAEQRADLLLETSSFKVENFYDDNGFFTISSKLRANGYSDFEIENLRSNVELQNRVKSAVEALKNSEDTPINNEEVYTNLEKTGEINSFGKLVSLNPSVVEKEAIEALVGISNEDQFNEEVNSLEYKNPPSFQEMQEYQKAEEFKEVNGEISERSENETELIIPLTIKEEVSLKLLEDISKVIEIPQNILDNNSEQVAVILKNIEDQVIEEGLDVVGLSKLPINKDFLDTLLEFLITPNRETTANVANAINTFFNRSVQPKLSAIKKAKEGVDYVKLDTNLSEEEVYKQSGLIKVEDGVYLKTSSQPLEELYAILETFPEKLPKGKPLKEYVQTKIAELEGFNNAEIAEAVILYKMYFGIINGAIQPSSSTNYANLTEDGKGNFVFYHVGAKGYTTIKAGTGQNSATSREETTALSRVGGLAMYYPAENVGETMVGGEVKYLIKVPKEKVYDFNKDELNLLEEAQSEFTTLYPNQAFDANNQLAFITKRAVQMGFDVVVAKWKDTTRVQTTKELKPVDFQELEGNTIKKDFKKENKLKSNKDKGWQTVEPKRQQNALNSLYTEIASYIESDDYSNPLYKLSEMSYYTFDSNFAPFKSQESITNVILNSTLPESVKNKYIEILQLADVSGYSIKAGTVKFTGNYEYLVKDFISDFYVESLREKQKNSRKYRDFYSNFEVNEKGISLKNTDALTIAKVKEYASEDLKQYSLISKQIPNLIETEQEEVSQRDLNINNPQIVEKYKGQIFLLPNNRDVILKNSTQEFIRVDSNVFEAVQTAGELTLYTKLDTTPSDYYQYEAKLPQTQTKLEDYKYLNTSPESFTTAKKYLSKKEEEKVDQDNFNCR